MKKQVLHSRRHHKRVETPEGVWVIWRCGRTEDTSRVKDLSVGGLFIETMKVWRVDATVELHFLVEDGEVRATATVRYVKAGELLKKGGDITAFGGTCHHTWGLSEATKDKLGKILLR